MAFLFQRQRQIQARYSSHDVTTRTDDLWVPTGQKQVKMDSDTKFGEKWQRVQQMSGALEIGNGQVRLPKLQLQTCLTLTTPKTAFR